MRVIKNCRFPELACLLVGGIVLLSGCGAPGPRALLRGESLLKEHRYDEAIEQLKAATILLPKTPQAWNHLGLAYHGAGQLDQAQRAYKHALTLDFNLAAVRYNLGCLALEQNDPLTAIEHLTSYATFEPNSAQGWVKLGDAQLRARRLDQAEKSYKNASELRPRSPEALNGLGNIAYHRRKPQEALALFSAALAEDPQYAPALLNNAVLHHSQNNRQLALREFKQYASLAPAPAPVELAGIIEQLERELAPPPAVVSVPAARTNALPPPPTRLAPTSAPPVVATTTHRSNPPPPIVTAPARAQKTPTNPVVRTTPSTTNKTIDPAVPVTQLEDEFVVKPVQDVPANTTRQTAASIDTNTHSAGAPNRDDKKGLIARLNPFNSAKPKPAGDTDAVPSAAVAPPPATNVARAASPPPSFPRYRHTSTALPKAGNRKQAERQFAEGVSAHRSGVLAQAVAKYQQATEADPAYFEAYYNLGLASYDLGRWKQSLAAYEVALALKPESIDTRYNFALALKQAGYPIDAAEELKQILKATPSEPRAHLSLGNLYAQQLNQPALARQHYLKLLAADPNHPRAGEIRYWLAANP
jgi:tetratricopeptide (TPR) repeat protein